MSQTLSFPALRARQSNTHDVFVFPATAQEVFQIAKIERAGRNDTGDLFGFQRPQIAQHIAEIREYLEKDDAVLPNSVVLAFVDGVEVVEKDGAFAEVRIDTSHGPCGQVVDGQQRLSALKPLEQRDFQVFVAAIVCSDEEELRRQFILINNTRPLPKELIYELLPTVRGLPHRLSSRSYAADLVAKLNFREDSSLKGRIRQHTSPGGILSSNAFQRVIMNSRSNGAIRDFVRSDTDGQQAFDLISDFYNAVATVFPEAWDGHTPKTSRLVHSVGLISMGYVMEIAYALHGARVQDDFIESLTCLKGECAWTSGFWHFENEVRPWDKLQNVNSDIRLLSDYLVRIVRDAGDSKSVELNRKIKPTDAQQAELAVVGG